MQILNYITSYFYNKIIGITKSSQKPNKMHRYVHNQDTNQQKRPKKAQSQRGYIHNMMKIIT
jgi:hypothetical protein